MRIRSALAAGTLLALAAIPAWTTTTLQWAADGVRAGAADADRWISSMTSDGAGGAVVVYVAGWSSGIRAQRFDASGARLWGDDGASVSTVSASPEYPVVVSDGNAFFFAWYDRRESDGNMRCYVQKLDDAGNARWALNGEVLQPQDPGSSCPPGLLSDGAGGVFVAWTGDGWIGAQRFDTDGYALWGTYGTRVCPYITGTGRSVQSLATDGAGGVFVAWQDWRSGSPDAYVQRVRADGTIAAGWPSDGVGLGDPMIGRGPPRIVADGVGGAILAWEDQKNANPDAPVFGQRVDADGDRLWNGGVAKQLSPPANGDDNIINSVGMDLVTDGAGGVVLTWRQGSGDFNDTTIRAQRFDKDGVALWNGGNPIDVCDATGAQADPRAAADGAGGMFVVWTDRRAGTVMNQAEDIYGQHVDAGGVLLWGASDAGLAICAAPGSASLQHVPRVVVDGTGGAIVAWQDWRGGATSDVRAQRITGAAAPEPIRQYLLPTKVTRSFNAKKPTKSALTLTAMLDTGPEASSLAGWVTVQIGAFERTLGGGFVADRHGVLRASDSTLAVTLVPSAGGASRCPLTVTLKGADVSLVPADGAIALRLGCGSVDAAGGCTLTKGRYARGGALPEGTTLLSSAKATLQKDGTWTFTASFVMAPGPVPSPMPDVAFAFGGSYAGTTLGAEFAGRQSVRSAKGVAGHEPWMTVDFKRGLVTVTGKKVPLGAFAEGPQTVRFVFGPAGEPAVIDVRMVKSGKLLTY